MYYVLSFFLFKKIEIMRNILFLFLAGILFFLNSISFAQAPEKFNYQAVIRDNTGELLINQDISLQISILDGSTTGSVMFSEEHSETTNAYGVVNIEIGNGVLVSGNFGSVSWDSGDKFLKIEIDETGGSTYSELGVVQLLSVPYALYANSANNLGDENIYTPVTDTLFVVKDHDGNVVFAVFPDGAIVYVNEGVKGRVGGFAISGRSPSKEGIETDIFIVTPDSTRIYVNDSLTVKGRVGGFAISGRSPSKGTINDYLQVTRDSTRIFVTESTTKGRVGGFAISGRSPSKGTETDYFNVSGNLSAQTIDPSEARIFWYPKKEAFLTGRVLVESADSVGTNSMATGFESKSIGEYSQALGYNARAFGENSTAIGNNANAVGNESYAIGNFAKTTNTGSYAIGSAASATGSFSFAVGSTGVDTAGNATSATMATADYAYAFGMGSIASAQGAFAFGTQDTASGEFSTAIGHRTKANNSFSTAMGNETTASGWNSTAMGYNTEASNSYSTAMGNMTTASGYNSMAMGNNTTASEHSSTAMGHETISIGYSSTSMGSNTTASGGASTAMGSHTTASGGASTAMGIGTTASGNASTAMGDNTLASGSYTTTIGRGIEAQGDYSFAISLNDQTGTIVSQESIMSVMGGKVGIGTVAPSELLEVDNGTSVGTYTTSGWMHASDKRLKTNIQVISNAKDIILNLEGVYFNWKTDTEKRQVGFIAQDVEKIIPEIISKNQDGYYSISYGNFAPIIVEAMKEQQSQIEDLKSENEALKQKLNEIIVLLESK